MKSLPSNPFFFLFGAFFCVALVVSNLLECKPIQIGSLLLTGGFTLFPITCLLNDAITELWGYKNSRVVIFSAVVFNMIMVLFYNIVVHIPSPTFWEEGEKFNFVFLLSSRITFASFVAFLCGALLDAYIMDRLRKKMPHRSFGLRAICSTLMGQTLDSLIFFPIAFGRIYEMKDLVQIMTIQIFLKTGYEVLLIPLCSPLLKKIKEKK
ncbi:MAG TPA: hypothetical protein DDY68_03815 [Porphyromonadaceae bacterium]|nr:hypothetical protein [Porphyromonadaceae bacterium]